MDNFVSLVDYHFRLVEIDRTYWDVVKDIPITDLEQKKELIEKLNLTYESLQDIKKYRTLKINGVRRKRTLVKEIKDETRNIFPFSFREIILTGDILTKVISVVFPGLYIFEEVDKFWKLCLTKTLEQEFYDDERPPEE